MGRKKKQTPEEAAAEEEERSKSKKKEPQESDDSSEEEELKHYDIDPEIQELAYAFNIDAGLTQRLNDVMIGKRHRTWEQDLARLHELLKEAHTPAAMLNLKVKDMEKGTFVGKAKCGPKVRELVKKHRLDKGAATKLEEAMAMREGMGKDVEKDLMMLDEHLVASNKPSALISMKLDSLRKGYSVGHCIYSREPVPGNQGPGVDGVVNKKGTGRLLGYTDADLDKRFSDSSLGGGSGQLMDEATIRKMMAEEKRKHMAAREEERPKAKKKDKSRSRSREKGKEKKKSKKEKAKDKDRVPQRERSESLPKRKKRSASSSGSRSRSRRRKSPSVTRKKPSRSRSRRRKSPSVTRKKSSGSPKRARSSSESSRRNSGKK